jgi:hypothetical protein
MKIRTCLNYLYAVIFGFFLTVNVFAAAVVNSQEQETFVRNVIEAVNNYDYQNYESQFKLASNYFTNSGWIEYKKALDDSHKFKCHD